MDESQNIKYKAIWKDEYYKWICGFANANGGRIFLGVDDDPPHKPVGLAESCELQGPVPRSMIISSTPTTDFFVVAENLFPFLFRKGNDILSRHFEAVGHPFLRHYITFETVFLPGRPAGRGGGGVRWW